MMQEKKKQVQASEASVPTGAEIPGALNASMDIAAAETHMDKFNASRGHGFAAEQANNLYDVLTGQDAAVIGGDNAKNGADRLVNGVRIQTKYCQEASASVAVAFDGGQYRYINPDGSLMQLEVPSDQYEKAVELMARRIEQGQVPGVTNPTDARDIVRRGHFTYDQAKNIVKFGTVESLTYDAVTGAVVSTSAFGITATLTFAQSLWKGDSPDIAVENAVYAGLQTGGAAFANSVITAQLMRLGLNKALAAPTNAVVQLMGSEASAALANSLREGAKIHGQAAMNNVSKLLRNNAVTSAVMTVVLSAKDIGYAFQGKISGAQLFKNITTTAGGMAGGTAGFLLGRFALNVIAPGAGEIVGIAVSMAGAAAGGAASGAATNAVVGKFIEDDAVKMTRIIEGVFCNQAQEYMLTQEELDIVLEDLKRELSGEALLDMFASKDHTAFADKLVREQIERLIRLRCRIYLPPEAEFVRGMGRLIEDAERGTGVFAKRVAEQVDPVEIGRTLTGQEISRPSAQKAWYATKQMNLAQVQAEGRLRKMAHDEKEYQKNLKMLRTERAAKKAELNKLLGNG